MRNLLFLCFSVFSFTFTTEALGKGLRVEQNLNSTQPAKVAPVKILKSLSSLEALEVACNDNTASFVNISEEDVVSFLNMNGCSFAKCDSLAYIHLQLDSTFFINGKRLASPIL